MYNRVIFLLLFLCTSCKAPLTVEMEYLSRENLPSYIVGTPDPLINCPHIGERLIIQWYLPKRYFAYKDLHLELKLHFGNYEEECMIIPIRRSMGTYLYDLIDDDYFCRCGLLSYKIDVVGSDCILTSWKHHLWAELIKLGE